MPFAFFRFLRLPSAPVHAWFCRAVLATHQCCLVYPLHVQRVPAEAFPRHRAAYAREAACSYTSNLAHCYPKQNPKQTSLLCGLMHVQGHLCVAGNSNAFSNICEGQRYEPYPEYYVLFSSAACAIQDQVRMYMQPSERSKQRTVFIMFV